MLSLLHMPAEIINDIARMVGMDSLAAIRHVCRDFAAVLPDEIPEDVGWDAAHNDHFEVLKWAFAAGYPIYVMHDVPAANGNIPMIEWIDENVDSAEREMCYMSGVAAAGNGHIHVLEWMKTNDWPFFPDLINYAASYGQMGVVKWLHAGGQEITPTTLTAAAGSGDIEMVKWMRSQGHELSSSTYHDAIARGQMEMVKWLRSEGCELGSFAACLAAKNGNLEMVKWVYSEGGDLINADIAASRNGHIHVLDWIISEMGSLDADTGDQAAAGGHIGVISWLMEKGYQITESTCNSATEHGLETLKWLRSRGCPWDINECAEYAVLQKHKDVLPILKYLRGHGCVFNNVYYCFQAAFARNRPALKWLLKHGCPWDRICENVEKSVRDWLHEDDCPCGHKKEK